MMTFAIRGSTSSLTARDRAVLFDRSTSSDPDVRDRTHSLVARVRVEGDAALLAMAREFDGVDLLTLEVPRVEWERALRALNPALRRALERAAANIRAVHEAFRPTSSELVTPEGVVVGRRADPLRAVGVYAPGGRAAYPSSLLMGVVPARVAGVGEVIVCSPPSRTGGRPPDVLLAAAAIAGVDRVFAAGGAGAIAALAYGTESIPRVDRIVGPGNAYVAEAKLQVSGAVAIDSPAGPSELLVLADETADPTVLAREILAQAEHDVRAAVVLVATSELVVRAVENALGELAAAECRRDTILAACAQRGALLAAPTMRDAEAFASAYAPEHLLIVARDAAGIASRVRNAGTIFIGAESSVAFGDYLTGANHVLPTGGLARCYSGLSTSDFVRWTTWQRVDRAAAASLADDVVALAQAEGLPAHAAAARQWCRKDDSRCA